MKYALIEYEFLRVKTRRRRLHITTDRIVPVDLSIVNIVMRNESNSEYRVVGTLIRH